jgi:hypothetical protein
MLDCHAIFHVKILGYNHIGHLRRMLSEWKSPLLMLI